MPVTSAKARLRDRLWADPAALTTVKGRERGGMWAHIEEKVYIRPPMAGRTSTSTNRSWRFLVVFEKPNLVSLLHVHLDVHGRVPT
jgi:hypothetical protein